MSDWVVEVEALKKSLAEISLPGGKVKLDKDTTVFDSERFVFGHLSMIEQHMGNELFRPYLERLQKFVALCQKEG